VALAPALPCGAQPGISGHSTLQVTPSLERIALTQSELGSLEQEMATFRVAVQTRFQNLARIEQVLIQDAQSSLEPPVKAVIQGRHHPIDELTKDKVTTTIMRIDKAARVCAWTPR
jgi:hypothetical protein